MANLKVTKNPKVEKVSLNVEETNMEVKVNPSIKKANLEVKIKINPRVKVYSVERVHLMMKVHKIETSSYRNCGKHMGKDKFMEE